MYNIAD